MTTGQNSPFDKLSFRQIVLLPKKNFRLVMKRDENVQPTRKKIPNLYLMPGFMISLLPLLLLLLLLLVKKLVQITATSGSR